MVASPVIAIKVLVHHVHMFYYRHFFFWLELGVEKSGWVALWYCVA
jgi:hypothetical protein